MLVVLVIVKMFGSIFYSKFFDKSNHEFQYSYVVLSDEFF